ncbi:MAG: DUF177 domain-containing protein [Pseudomonadota bacterium]
MMDQSSGTAPLEFSRPLETGDLEDGDEGIRHLVADDDERAALRARFDLLSLDSLEADLRYRRDDRIVEVSGRLQGNLTQTCVVSLEPVAETVDEDFVRRFDPDMAVSEDDELDLTVDDLLDEAVCDPLVDDTIDLGEVVAEQLGLAINPYPRKEGAQIDPRYAARATEDDEETNPFAVLKKLKL